ncbi:hypothetical protein IWX76_002686 [Pedobacter sp. CAN_A7]|uniref:hypothetical protein n=1 Tax=Pedobacter sp. CAN_A7 TaxID=2787722 RepID=UPI0018C99267
MTYKYKIEEFLENLPVRENKMLVNQIPDILGVSYNTFRNYCKIPLKSKKDIPYECVRKLEILFGMTYGELTNAQPNGKHYLELVKKNVVIEQDEVYSRL